jgi:hypothetical protein
MVSAFACDDTGAGNREVRRPSEGPNERLKQLPRARLLQERQWRHQSRHQDVRSQPNPLPIL